MDEFTVRIACSGPMLSRDTPYLFLEFARLREKKDPDEAIRTWVARYGLLGLQKEQQLFRSKFPPGKIFPPKEYKSEGGPSETLDNIRREIQRASYALRMYEAASSKDQGKLEQADIVREWLTYREAEQLVGLSRTTLWKLIGSGEVE